jgi:hypothetical protein
MTCDLTTDMAETKMLVASLIDQPEEGTCRQHSEQRCASLRPFLSNMHSGGTNPDVRDKIFPRLSLAM